MKKDFLIALFFMFIPISSVLSQSSNDTLAYLITCGPGTETYSIYGHSALRIVITSKNSDTIYNWGVFDFDTPNFAWKFAKGRLDYMISAEKAYSFMQVYVYEQRYVLSQKINLDSQELRKLVALVNENMKPENRKYRYDFFYDDCSTRIRDLLEKSIGEILKYPPSEPKDKTTFRDMVGKYQAPYPWLKLGVDLIMGSTSDKKASLRDRMFLPIDMKEGLSKAVVHRSGKMIPLLQNPQTLVDFATPSGKLNFFMAPPFVFTLAIVIVMILGGLVKNRRTIRIIDIFIYTVFSVLAILMIFFNFFTDHGQMKWNLNILWLNPFIIACLAALLLNKEGQIWFRIVFFISAAFLILQYVLPQNFEIAFSLLTIILLIRSSVRCGFEWNPLTLK
jgi:hypothetical protein